MEVDVSSFQLHWKKSNSSSFWFWLRWNKHTPPYFSHWFITKKPRTEYMIQTYEDSEEQMTAGILRREIKTRRTTNMAGEFSAFFLPVSPDLCSRTGQFPELHNEHWQKKLPEKPSLSGQRDRRGDSMGKRMHGVREGHLKRVNCHSPPFFCTETSSSREAELLGWWQQWWSHRHLNI